MSFRLLVHSETAGEEPRTIVVAGHQATLGRDRKCDVQLNEAGVSHRHATVFHCGRSFLVTDEGSANGTFVDDTPLAPRSARLVQPGQSLRVGRARIEIHNAERPAPAPNPSTCELALAMAQEMTSGTHGERATPWIAVTSGPDSGKALLLHDEGKAYVIGRGSSVELSLDDERVSRRQLSVMRRGAEVFVAGLAQNLRASLGDHPLTEGVEVRWLTGATLAIAQSEIGLFDPSRELHRNLYPTAERPRDMSGHIDGLQVLAPTAPFPVSAVSSDELEAPSSVPPASRPARKTWTPADIAIVIIGSSAIVGAVAVLVWLFFP